MSLDMLMERVNQQRQWALNNPAFLNKAKKEKRRIESSLIKKDPRYKPS
ncbi:hypothetical protein [Photobacterium iliopiscarium]|jgi:hypothetical protein|nr:hypothetical protein [Photobacterium iliopiscarium]